MCRTRRDLYAAFLEFHGFATVAAEDGITGLALATALTPDAVVLDFSMPRMDGAEVLRRLKADSRTHDVPIVMVTAMPELVPSAARAACAGFFDKPCEPERLVQVIEDLLLAQTPRGPRVDGLGYAAGRGGGRAGGRNGG